MRPTVKFAANVAIGGLLATLLVCCQAQTQQRIFYAIGRNEQSKGNNLYEINAANMLVVRSIGVWRNTIASGIVSMRSGMLTGKRNVIVMTDAEMGLSGVMLVSAPDLHVQSEMEITRHRSPMCLDNLFVEPVTDLAYFSCREGSSTLGLLVLDVGKKAIVTDLPIGYGAYPVAYDSKRQWLYLLNGTLIILDARNHVVGSINTSGDRASYIGGKWVDSVLSQIQGASLLPNGNLALITRTADNDNPQSILMVYDPIDHKVLRKWTDTEKVTDMVGYWDSRAQKLVEIPTLQWARLRCGPVPSRDGSRLFGISSGRSIRSGGDIVVWNSRTLEELHRFNAPEIPNSEASIGGCFAPAPDGRGMWYFGRSGKIYRFDDKTGALLGEVKLPFHLISLIREP